MVVQRPGRYAKTMAIAKLPNCYQMLPEVTFENAPRGPAKEMLVLLNPLPREEAGMTGWRMHFVSFRPSTCACDLAVDSLQMQRPSIFRTI
jgi:hypothetical protein